MEAMFMKNSAPARSNQAFIELMRSRAHHLEVAYLLHHHTSDTFKATESRIGTSMIVLAGVATFTLSIQTPLSKFLPEWLNEVLKLVPLACSTASIALASLIRVMNYSLEAFQHQQVAARYRHLLNRCEAYLAERESESLSTGDSDLEEGISKEMYDLEKSSLPIPKRVYEKRDEIIEGYRRTYERSGRSRARD
jgi:hypothetical protein